jgi:HSP20 family protein
MADTRDSQRHSDDREQRGGLQRRETASDRLARRGPFEMFGGGPFSLMRRMQEDMDRLFGDLWGGNRLSSGFSEGGRSEWAPAIEAFHRGNEFVIRADVPGLSPNDITVEIGEDTVTIQGERKYDHKEEREGVIRSERGYGTFYRVIPLPEGAVSESAKATFKDGVLEIVAQAPSQEVKRGRRIEIAQESSEKR